jgi:hypothetical protein
MKSEHFCHIYPICLTAKNQAHLPVEGFSQRFYLFTVGRLGAGLGRYFPIPISCPNNGSTNENLCRTNGRQVRERAGGRFDSLLPFGCEPLSKWVILLFPSYAVLGMQPAREFSPSYLRSDTFFYSLSVPARQSLFPVSLSVSDFPTKIQIIPVAIKLRRQQFYSRRINS